MSTDYIGDCGDEAERAIREDRGELPSKLIETHPYRETDKLAIYHCPECDLENARHLRSNPRECERCGCAIALADFDHLEDARLYCRDALKAAREKDEAAAREKDEARERERAMERAEKMLKHWRAVREAADQPTWWEWLLGWCEWLLALTVFGLTVLGMGLLISRVVQWLTGLVGLSG